MQPRKIPPVCLSCKYEPGTDLGKYAVVFYKGRLRIMLEKVALTMLSCPKCGLTLVTKDFKKKQVWEFKKMRERKSKKRVAKLRELYSKSSFSMGEV